MPSFGGGSGTGSIQPPTPPSSLLCSGGALGLDLLLLELLELRIPSPHPPPTHDPIIGLGAVTRNKPSSSSPLARLSPSPLASGMRNRARSPPHQELLLSLHRLPVARERHHHRLTPGASRTHEPVGPGQSMPWGRSKQPCAHRANAKSSPQFSCARRHGPANATPANAPNIPSLQTVHTPRFGACP